MFVDKRSQDKVYLLSSGDKDVPQQALEFLDIRDIPVCCGGQNTDPIIDLMTTFEA